MPLPPAPTQRASRLSRQAIDTLPPATQNEEVPESVGDTRPSAPRKTRSRPVATAAAASPVHTPHSSSAVKPASATRKRKPQGPTKLFVLDTNVLLHDPMSLFRFDEHDVYLPMITLEELDGHKKGIG